MRPLPHWDKTDAFMGKEYAMKWVDFKAGMGEDVCTRRYISEALARRGAV